MPVLIEVSLFAPFIIAPLALGFLAASFSASLLLAPAYTAAYVGTSVFITWAFSIEYTLDTWVGDPGFVSFLMVQFLVMLAIVVILALPGVVLAKLWKRKREQSGI